MKKQRTVPRRFTTANDMVVEIVGTVLLLGITIAVLSTAYATVFSYPAPSSIPHVNLLGTIEGDAILIEHRGGDALSLKTRITFSIGNTPPDSITVGEGNYLKEEAKRDKLWNVGEQLIYPLGHQPNQTSAEICVVDPESNALIFIGTLDIRSD